MGFLVVSVDHQVTPASNPHLLKCSAVAVSAYLLLFGCMSSSKSLCWWSLCEFQAGCHRIHMGLFPLWMLVFGLGFREMSFKRRSG